MIHFIYPHRQEAVWRGLQRTGVRLPRPHQTLQLGGKLREGVWIPQCTVQLEPSAGPAVCCGRCPGGRQHYAPADPGGGASFPIGSEPWPHPSMSRLIFMREERKERRVGFSLVGTHDEPRCDASVAHSLLVTHVKFEHHREVSHSSCQ